MSKVRLYHLARNWDVPASMILEELEKKGRRVKSHFVEVDSAEVPEIRAILQDAGLFGRPAAAAVEAPPPPAHQPVEARAPEPARRCMRGRRARRPPLARLRRPHGAARSPTDAPYRRRAHPDLANPRA